MRQRRLTRTCITALLAWACVSAAQLRAEDYACWVSRPDGTHDVVLVDAANRDRAARAAVQPAPAERGARPGGLSTPAGRVEQCIARLREQFSDPEAARRLASMPL